MKSDDQVLAHYASPYYDPVKAHEYYMRNRELKGRNKTIRSKAKLNDQGKKVWEVTKDSITQEKKSKVTTEQNNRKTKTEQHRSSAKATRERITAKLKELNTKLSQSTSTKIQQIRKSSMPKENKEAAIAKLRELRDGEKARNYESAGSKRQAVASELKSVISATREAYKTAKKNIDESYEQIYQQEYDKILKEYAKPKR